MGFKRSEVRILSPRPSSLTDSSATQRAGLMAPLFSVSCCALVARYHHRLKVEDVAAVRVHLHLDPVRSARAERLQSREVVERRGRVRQGLVDEEGVRVAVDEHHLALEVL